jgi:hypothetical protein
MKCDDVDDYKKKRVKYLLKEKEKRGFLSTDELYELKYYM